MDISLSGKDIYNKLDGKVNIMSYSDLMKYNNIDDALGKYGALVLLYESRDNYGHWTLVFKRNKNTIEHFDSYGIIPDDQFDYIDPNFLMKEGINEPYLTHLLYKSGYNVEYNDYKLQEMDNNIKTCGKWVILRLLKRNINIDDFAKFFINNPMHNDLMVDAIYNELFK